MFDSNSNFHINVAGVGPLYLQDLNLIITEPADASAT